ncbi:FkbM family methyltransferase [Alisedimentitalea sp. MJ-SS2]|uniref:FkbM family methyltransferase n=1 Tax=Aliisedimentitalea sp. MJ-SS2 TaxID=3049795 RepID=UPI00290DEB92|nr:FkbM family methyltransferase [Alisedimentitalea sp. MJ-SS2]MDU8929421.1 FkbM family methyltransferase [Alisedimentitalea sp. MJ-SS2]
MGEVQRFLAKETLKSVHKEMRGHRPPLALFNYDLIGRHMVCDGFYELALLECLENHVFPRLTSRKLCLDIGANVGNHSAFFAPFFDRTIAFEPNLRALKLLEANAMLFDNIEPRNYGLSSAEGTAIASYNSASVGAASISIDREGEFTTEFHLKRLDDVLSEDEKSQVAFMKIDVEGHELDVLEGARETLNASSPVVVLEVLPQEIKDGTTEPMKLLQDEGYAHCYTMVDSAPMARRSERLAKLLNTLSVLFRGRKILEKFELQKLEGGLEQKQYAMIVLSREELPVSS